jgi:hypothetical protein
VSRRAGFAEAPSQQDRQQNHGAAAFERRRRGRLHAMCATRSSETDAIWQRGMEGKGQVIEDSHDLLVIKNLDNCVSIQVR